MSEASKRKNTAKARAIKLIHKFPKNSSWDELMHQIYVRQKIEAELSDIKAGKVHTHAAICKEFGAIA